MQQIRNRKNHSRHRFHTESKHSYHQNGNPQQKSCRLPSINQKNHEQLFERLSKNSPIKGIRTQLDHLKISYKKQLRDLNNHKLKKTFQNQSQKNQNNQLKSLLKKQKLTLRNRHNRTFTDKNQLIDKHQINSLKKIYNQMDNYKTNKQIKNNKNYKNKIQPCQNIDLINNIQSKTNLFKGMDNPIQYSSQISGKLKIRTKNSKKISLNTNDSSIIKTSFDNTYDYEESTSINQLPILSQLSPIKSNDSYKQNKHSINLLPIEQNPQKYIETPHKNNKTPEKLPKISQLQDMEYNYQHQTPEQRAIKKALIRKYLINSNLSKQKKNKLEFQLTNKTEYMEIYDNNKCQLI